MAVMVLMRVSKSTPMDWDSPCLAGCSTLADEEMLVMVPSPASLDQIPLFRAMVSMAPTPPPTIEGTLNAHSKMEATASGMFPACIRMTAEHMTTQARAMNGMTSTEIWATLLNPPMAIMMPNTTRMKAMTRLLYSKSYAEVNEVEMVEISESMKPPMYTAIISTAMVMPSFFDPMPLYTLYAGPPV